MEAIENINVRSLLDTLVSLTTAFVMGGLIGFERQVRQRTAGLRTNILVAVGAAVFVDAANRLHGHEGAVRTISYVVSGIGFLGAGVIMREQGNVRGLNTAATLWGSAAVGACAGSDLILEAVLGTGFVLAANTLLRPVADRINRQPMDGTTVEVTNTVTVIATHTHRKEALGALEEMLEEANIPTRDIEIRAFGEDEVTIEATLTPASVAGDELDQLVARIAALSVIRQAFWSPSTRD
ncbi:MAG: MgtC/SapB family protein [Labilithrix sp.]|nr:MgtC/SapB family protein [Labilithrix sp.]MCW5836231.1 MgtC/SapB family protein [Labilithrix sp.]